MIINRKCFATKSSIWNRRFFCKSNSITLIIIFLISLISIHIFYLMSNNHNISHGEMNHEDRNIITVTINHHNFRIPSRYFWNRSHRLNGEVPTVSLLATLPDLLPVDPRNDPGWEGHVWPLLNSRERALDLNSYLANLSNMGEIDLSEIDSDINGIQEFSGIDYAHNEHNARSVIIEDRSIVAYSRCTLPKYSRIERCDLYFDYDNILSVSLSFSSIHRSNIADIRLRFLRFLHDIQ